MSNQSVINVLPGGIPSFKVVDNFVEEFYECDNCGNVWDGNAQCLCGGGMASDSDDIESDANENCCADFERNETIGKVIQPVSHLVDNFVEEFYECDNCGNVWDGNAQCLCGGGMASDSDDIESISSNASDMLADFEETGHIQNETSRINIRQMLTVARSLEKTDEAPEWMDETIDYMSNGEFVNGEYKIAPLPSPVTSVREIQRSYPMLTGDELDQFTVLMNDGMVVDDIIDGFNLKRFRDYDDARIDHLHWPQIETRYLRPLEMVRKKGTGM